MYNMMSFYLAMLLLVCASVIYGEAKGAKKRGVDKLEEEMDETFRTVEHNYQSAKVKRSVNNLFKKDGELFHFENFYPYTDENIIKASVIIGKGMAMYRELNATLTRLKHAKTKEDKSKKVSLLMVANSLTHLLQTLVDYVFPAVPYDIPENFSRTHRDVSGASGVGKSMKNIHGGSGGRNLPIHIPIPVNY